MSRRKKIFIVVDDEHSFTAAQSTFLRIKDELGLPADSRVVDYCKETRVKVECSAFPEMEDGAAYPLVYLTSSFQPHPTRGDGIAPAGVI